jgi:hypothetical protein
VILGCAIRSFGIAASLRTCRKPSAYKKCAISIRASAFPLPFLPSKAQPSHSYINPDHMMCSSDHHNAGLICCSIIPPHVLEHVVRAPGASEKQRIIAFNTLKAMDRVHRAREALGRTALASCGISSSIGDRSLAGSRPLIPSYVYSEISNAEGASEETKERLKLNIRVSDKQACSRTSACLDPDKRTNR